MRAAWIDVGVPGGMLRGVSESTLAIQPLTLPQQIAGEKSGLVPPSFQSCDGVCRMSSAESHSFESVVHRCGVFASPERAGRVNILTNADASYICCAFDTFITVLCLVNNIMVEQHFFSIDPVVLLVLQEK